MSRARLRAIAAPLVTPLAILALHAVALRALYALDVVGRLLGRASVPPFVLAALVAGFYAVRLAALFIAPGLLVVGLVRAVRIAGRPLR